MVWYDALSEDLALEHSSSLKSEATSVLMTFDVNSRMLYIVLVNNRTLP